MTVLYPWSKIREDAENQKDILGAKNIKQTYETISKGKNWLTGTLRGLKGKGGVCTPALLFALGEGLVGLHRGPVCLQRCRRRSAHKTH